MLTDDLLETGYATKYIDELKKYSGVIHPESY
jgi:hypothetical protein